MVPEFSQLTQVRVQKNDGKFEVTTYRLYDDKVQRPCQTEFFDRLVEALARAGEIMILPTMLDHIDVMRKWSE